MGPWWTKRRRLHGYLVRWSVLVVDWLNFWSFVGHLGIFCYLFFDTFITWPLLVTVMAMFEWRTGHSNKCDHMMASNLVLNAPSYKKIKKLLRGHFKSNEQSHQGCTRLSFTYMHWFLFCFQQGLWPRSRHPQASFARDLPFWTLWSPKLPIKTQ